jgi:DNA uptake protein ComE-like DNA-binding protein
MIFSQHFEHCSLVTENTLTQEDCETQINKQCQILAQCIEDIQLNSKKYHISYMLEIINYASAEEIVEKLNLFDYGFANRIVYERRKGIFESIYMLSRAGVTRSKVTKILKANV